jgi:LacI family transcriptional regulator
MAIRRKVLMALDWYDAELHTGIAEYARTKDWVLNTHMARTRQLPLGWEGDGVIALIDQPATAAFVKDLKLPVVDFGGHFNDFPQILSDNHQVGVMGAEYLLEKNHQRFVFLHLQNSRLEREISTGFSMAVEAAGFHCEMHYWKKGETEQAINYRAVQEWSLDLLKDLEKPVALMCQNDDTAAIVLQAAFDGGIRIPEEVAILGNGNNQLVCDFLPRTLSSIDPDLRGLGFAAARELDRLFSGEPARKATMRIPPKCIYTRESTDFLAVSNPSVMRVLRYIWDNYNKPLNIEKLTSLVPVSRSALYNLFIDEVGRPMARELMRVRVEHAKRMLKTTDLNISTIGKQCGFSSLINFSRAFSQKVGQSPREYRYAMRNVD